jgi:RsiW-degrading membrane proteinase PrsW (M82 family)
LANVPFIAMIIGTAFLPPLVFMAYVRNQEKEGREPWSALFAVFLFGAIVSVVVALILEQTFHVDGREYELLRGQFTVPSIIVLVLVIAPLTEEFSKALGVRVARRRILEAEDGIIYGAAVGFGFSATENLFYELSALHANGQAAYVVTALVRTFTGCFLHATAAGIVGYGLGIRYRERRGLLVVLPYYLAAVLLHAAFNFVAVLNFGFAVGIIIVLSFLAIRFTVRRIRALDSVPVFRADRSPPL